MYLFFSVRSAFQADVKDFFPRVDLVELERVLVLRVLAFFGGATSVFLVRALAFLFRCKFVLLGGGVWRKLSSLSISETIATAVAQIYRYESMDSRIVPKYVDNIAKFDGYIDDLFGIFRQRFQLK